MVKKSPTVGTILKIQEGSNTQHSNSEPILKIQMFWRSVFFYMSAIVYPLSTVTLWTNECLFINIELGLNAIPLSHEKCSYSKHQNTEHLNTGFIWIPDSMGVQYSNGQVTWLSGHFEYQTFWTKNWLFQTTIWQPDNNLPFKYQTSLVFRWLLY